MSRVNTSMQNYNIKKRTKARKFAMQALYTWQISDNSILSIQEYYLADRNPDKFDSVFFAQILKDITAKLDLIDTQISKVSNIPKDSISPIELSILRVGAYELMFCPATPVKVIINEGLELSKTFGAVDSHKFVNAVLDKIATEFRANEPIQTEISPRTTQDVE